ncbi:MAG: GPW/gp25 family protein [Bacteroidetes bacterium]|nr:GPW/gp25 family protein [Bacteroidota bacterium]MBS1739932.1 GPW/gp25 family protein [Bacteroidota bacterium]MBS1777579.1 GPW/gp25 family protein [Bacteroidota bacterium]
MANPLLKLPLNLSRVLEGNELTTLDLQDSIMQSLRLILTTRFGEHKYDLSYGCEIWDLDFELIVSESMWEEKLRMSILSSIRAHEKRLANISIDLSISEVPFSHYSHRNAQIKKQVDIVIKSLIVKTGEPFVFQTKLFLSPLTVA